MIKKFNKFRKYLNESNTHNNTNSKISHILEKTYPDISSNYLTKIEELFSLCKDASANKDIDMKKNQIDRITTLLNEIDWSKIHYFYTLKMLFYIERFNINKSIKNKMLLKRLDDIILKIKEVGVIDLLLSSNTFIDFISTIDIKIGISNNEYYDLYKVFKKYDKQLPIIIVGYFFFNQKEKYILRKYYLVEDEIYDCITYDENDKDYLKQFKYLGECDEILGSDYKIKNNISILAKQEYPNL